MKLATWNINSLTVRLPQLLAWLDTNPVDVIVLQETKQTDDKFPHAELAAAGYHAHWFGQKTYNGVALLTRKGSDALIKNIPDLDDDQARVISATVLHDSLGPIRVIGAYIPNGQAPDSDKFVYKMRWLTAFEQWVKGELAKHPRLVLMGDFNIAPTDADVHDLHAARARPLSTSAGSGHARCLPALRAAAQAVELVGLPQPGFSQEPGPAHRPHPGE
jgi:exodeoxyribonuclease-3